MTDVVSNQRRSEIMSHIKSKDTSIELLIRKRLFSLGYRYRVNLKELPGKPDIAFTKKKIAIFLHGCFWHGHEIGCRHSHTSKSRKEYWEEKIAKTKLRDEKNFQLLVNSGWKVIVIWECEIKKNFNIIIEKIIECINNS